jgi:hypothetical protein
MGLETHLILKEANTDLRNQRDVIINVSDKTKDMRRDLSLADKKVDEMSRREAIYKLALYLTILLVIVADILTLVLKIKG